MNSRKWYCCVAQPNQDVRFARDLGERGHDVHIAFTFARQRVGVRYLVEAKLLLSPYVWTCVDLARGQNFNTVKQTYGYADVVSLSAGGQATEIPEQVIQGLRFDQIQDYEAAVRRVRRKESIWKEGDHIKVMEGHDFAGYDGRVSRARPGAVIAELGPNKIPVRLSDDEIVPFHAFAGRQGRLAS